MEKKNNPSAKLQAGVFTNPETAPEMPTESISGGYNYNEAKGGTNKTPGQKGLLTQAFKFSVQKLLPFVTQLVPTA